MDPGALVNKARKQKEEVPVKATLDPHGQLAIKIIKLAKDTSPGFNLSEALEMDVNLYPSD